MAVNEVMRFDALTTLADVAVVAGVPVDVVIVFCDSHSLPGLAPDSVIMQSSAEQIARALEGRT